MRRAHRRIVLLDTGRPTTHRLDSPIGPGLLTAILRDCEVDRDDFIALL